MRIGLKLTLALVLPLVALTLFLGFAFETRSRELLREELVREGRAIARVVQIASEDYLRDRQVRDLRQLADRISGYERVFGVRLFDADGALTYQPAVLDPYPFQHWTELRAAMSERRTIEMRRSVGEDPAVGFIVPLFNRRGTLMGAVQVLQLESYIAEDARATRDFVLQLTLATALATLVIVLLVARVSIGGPISRLVRSFREVGAREVPTRVEVRGDDELARLSREFNGMCERLETTLDNLRREQEHRRQVEAELRNAERLAGLGRLAAGLAHEIGTPLNVILGRAESLQRSRAGDTAAERHLGIIVAQSERIARIVRDMLDFARMKPRRHRPTSVREAVEAAVELIERRCEEQRVVVDLHLPPDLPDLVADPDQLQQVFLNLTANALDAMPEGGTLAIRAAVAMASSPERDEAPRECVVVSVADSGAGIEPSRLPHLFDPFYTTKDAGRGTGLGLSVAYGIIEEHGGWFTVRSEPGAGATFTVHLPVGSAANPGGGAA